MTSFKNLTLEEVLREGRDRFEFALVPGGIAKLIEPRKEVETLLTILEIVKNLDHGQEIKIKRHEPEHHFHYSIELDV
jgi:hypothetical protein